MGRPPLGKQAMTPTERQRKWRKRVAREKKLANPRLMAKQEKRGERERALAGRISALPDKRYGVILADPEWRFEPWSRETGMDRAADNHYPTSELEEIKARDVASIAAADCILFLWATSPMLPQALEVMRAWGFAYKSQAIWAKDRAGTGYWFRNEHEILLVGTRGNVPAPAPGTQWGSLISAPVGAHSEKPAEVYEMIEAYFPNLPKIELNARACRDGWDAWGLEADSRPPTAANG
jgi:N6-adenosine-specific RNA methylase IME4